MAVSFWLKLAFDVSAAWVSLSLIRHIIDPPGRYWVVVNRVVQACFGTAIVLLAEKLFVRIIAIQFHQKALAVRIRLSACAKQQDTNEADLRTAYTRTGSPSRPLTSCRTQHRKRQGRSKGPDVALLDLTASSHRVLVQTRLIPVVLALPT